MQKNQGREREEISEQKAIVAVHLTAAFNRRFFIAYSIA